MSLIGAAIGAGSSLLGGMMGGGGSAPEYKFRPSQARTALGTAGINKDGTINVDESGASSAQRMMFDRGIQGFLSDPTGQQQFGQNVVSQGQNMFMPAFQAAQQGGYGASGAQLGAMGNLFNQQQGLLQQGGAAGINAAFQGPSAAGATGMAGQMAQGLLSQTNLSQLASDRTAQLNQLARPSEERAVNQKFQSLFGSGRLGTTGGQRGLGELALAQEQAATQRGLAGMDFANQVRMQNLQAGSGFLGQQLQGIGMDQGQAMNLGRLGAGLFGQAGQNQGMMFDATMGLDQANITRGQQRLQNAQGLFGFGQQQMEAPFASAGRTLAAMQPINQNMFNLAQLPISGAQVRSGMSGGSSSPLGSSLMGLGSGLFDAAVSQDGFFDF